MNTENNTMTKDGKEVCPCCDRHCPVDNLHCPKGKEHFGLPVEEGEREGRGEHGEHRHGGERGCGRGGHGHGREGKHGRGEHGYSEHGHSEGKPQMRPIDEENMTLSEVTMTLLRQCGHFLHHNVESGADYSEMFAMLKEEEQMQLNAALKKCLAGWQQR